MAAFNQWQNITLDELFHPDYYSALRNFEDGIFTISIFVFLGFLYIILAHSTPQMGTFKYTMSAQLIFNFLLECFLFYYCPVFYFPLPVVGYFSHFPIGNGYYLLQTIPIICLMICTILVYILSLFLRVIATFQIQYSLLISRYGYLIFGTFSLLCAFFSGAIAVALSLLEANSEIAEQEYMLEVPALQELFQRVPTTTVMGNNKYFIFYILVGVIFSSVIIPAWIVLNILFVFRLRKLKNASSKEAYKLHAMLHTTLSVQMLVIAAFVIFPFIIFVGVMILQLANASWYANLVVPIASLHILFDAITVIYFVKPYRKFIITRFQYFRQRNADGSLRKICTVTQRPHISHSMHPKFPTSNLG